MEPVLHSHHGRSPLRLLRPGLFNDKPHVVCERCSTAIHLRPCGSFAVHDFQQDGVRGRMLMEGVTAGIQLRQEWLELNNTMALKKGNCTDHVAKAGKRINIHGRLTAKARRLRINSFWGHVANVATGSAC
jgi:hypothetical protein